MGVGLGTDVPSVVSERSFADFCFLEVILFSWGHSKAIHAELLFSEI